MNNKLQLYYWNGESNMGDSFNVDLCQLLMGSAPQCSSPEYCEAAFCGSLLDDFLLQKVFPLEYKTNAMPVNIWGAGFITSKWNWLHGLRKFLPESYFRYINVYAVRDMLSKKRIEKILRKKIDAVVADPGLLASYFIQSIVKKEFDIGIIPHHIERNLAIYDKLKKGNYCLIDVSSPPKYCIEQIARCRVILSSSLHGLIFADSLGIPNARLVASDKLIGGNYKFNDYYSSFSEQNRLTIDIRKTDVVDIEKVIKEYFVPKQEVDKKKLQLINSFPYEIQNTIIQYKCNDGGGDNPTVSYTSPLFVHEFRRAA